jgi:tripartite-type tricarboxylate transporter receptor subunit TctC
MASNHVPVRVINRAGAHAPDGSKRSALIAAALALGLFVPGLASAQTFPSKPVHVIVPFAPGGAFDVLARVIAAHLEQQWRQSVLVETKPGAGSVVGTTFVARANPDGHTLVLVANSLVINAKLRPTLPYDAIKGFEPIALMVNSPQVIAVNPSSPYRTLKEWLDAARAQPGTLTLGTVGPGTTQHIAGEMLQRAAGVKLVYVPFPGGAPAVNAVLGDHVGAVLGNLSEVSAHIAAGKLRPLAVTTRDRLDELKQVPTVAESGYAGYEAVVWCGISAPAGTPREVVQRISDSVGQALRDAEVRQRLLVVGFQPAYLNPTDFAAHVADMAQRYSRVIEDAKITLE